MYINYLNDRLELGFICKKDIETAKILNERISIAYLNQKGKQTFIIIFSKETLVASLIFLNSSCINAQAYSEPPLFSSNEVHVCRVMKQDNAEDLNSLRNTLDSPVKVRGGSDEFNHEETEKLVKSILAKARNSDYSEMSLNKVLNKLYKVLNKSFEMTLGNPKLLRILSEFEKPLPSKLADISEVRSSDSITPIGLDPKTDKTKIRIKRSSSLFVEGFETPTGLTPMRRKVITNMTSKSNNPQRRTSELFSTDSKSQEINLNIKSEYKEFMKAMGNKNYSLDCSESRFRKLSIDLDTNKIKPNSLSEAKIALEIEAKGFVKDIQRPLQCKLDFEITGINEFEKFTHMDVKKLVSKEFLESKNAKPNPLPKQAYECGKKSINQQRKHTIDKTRLPDAPLNENNVLTAVDLSDIRTSAEVNNAKSQFLKGVQEKDGDPNSIIFLDKN